MLLPQVIDNDGLHGMEKVSGMKELTAGQHVRNIFRLRATCCRSTCPLVHSFPQEISVDFFQAEGGSGLILYWSGPGVPKPVAIPASAFRCNPEEQR
jgi:hypothetical protein